MPGGSPSSASAVTNRVAVPLVLASVGLVVVVGSLGTSAAVPPLNPGPSARAASPWLVTGLLAAAVLLGAAGTLLGLQALARGWAPRPGRLLAVGVVAVLAVLVVAPVGSADVGSYAAYGRLAATGADPYLTVPAARPNDPVVAAAEDPWRSAPSVYGPLATAEQALVSYLAGSSRAATIRGLAVAAALAFLGTGLLLDRLCRGDASRQRRAALLWTANPVLLLELVAGAHLDGLLALLVLAGVASACPLVSGVLLGLAGSVKASAALPALGMAAVLRHERQRLTGWAGAVLVTVTAAYLFVGGARALGPAARAGRMVSGGTPWRLVASGMERLLDPGEARTIVMLAAAALTVVLARRLHRRLAPALQEARPAVSARVSAAARGAFATSLAWALLAPYALPWYDATAWVLLGLIGASTLDGVLLAHTSMLALAYLPGRTLPLPTELHAALTALRSGVCPAVLLVLLLIVFGLPIPRGRRTARAVTGTPRAVDA